MKLAWWRAASPLATSAAPVVEAETAPSAPVASPPAEVSPADTGVVRLDPALPWELRLLCRGLVGCAWSAQFGAVTTDVHLPGDDAHALALRALCREIADEFELEQLVCRQGDAWIVRFSRREVGTAATEEAGERFWIRAASPLFGVLAHPDEAPRYLHGPRLRGRAHPA